MEGETQVIPYEHRGKAIRALLAKTPSDVDALVKIYSDESDVWLRKMIALKIVDAHEAGLSVDDIDHYISYRHLFVY